MPIYEITVTHLSGARRSKVETFTKLPLRLGRGEECEVRFDAIDDRQVSALHAEVIVDAEGALRLKDLESKNGVFLDGERVEGDAPLPGRAVIEVGQNGPKIQLAWEAATGISFSRLKKDELAKVVTGRPLATTDDAIPVHAGSGEKPLLPLAIGAALLLLGLATAAWFFTR